MEIGTILFSLFRYIKQTNVIFILLFYCTNHKIIVGSTVVHLVNTHIFISILTHVFHFLKIPILHVDIIIKPHHLSLF